MSESEDGSLQERKSRRERFNYKPRHLIMIFRQVATDNPFQFERGSQQKKAWKSIGAALRKDGITAQARSSQLKVQKMLDDHDKKRIKLPESTTDAERKELSELLEEVALLRKEGASQYKDEAKKRPAVRRPVPSVKSFRASTISETAHQNHEESEMDEFEEDNSEVPFQLAHEPSASGRRSASREANAILAEYMRTHSEVDVASKTPAQSTTSGEPALDEIDHQARAWAIRIRKYDARQRRALMRGMSDRLDDMETAFETSSSGT